MWFQFPEGCTEISVQQQNYIAEVTDEDGNSLFRAPEHFAGLILDIPGFKIAMKVPADAPEDLPKGGSTREISDLLVSGKIDRLEMENETLRAAVATLNTQLSDLKLAVANSKALLTQYQEEFGELPNETPEIKTGKK